MGSPPTSNVGSPGGLGYLIPVTASALMTVEMASRNVAMPSVTTMPMTRGYDEMRRISPASISPAIPAPAMMPTGKAIQYGTPARVTSAPSTAAPKTPTAVCAKLMNLLAR